MLFYLDKRRNTEYNKQAVKNQFAFPRCDMVATVVIAVITIILFLVSVIFFPCVGKKRKFKIYPLIPLAGGAFTVVLGNLSIERLVTAFTENTSVNPIKILVLFLSMTVYSLILDRTGFFAYISGVVLKKAGDSQIRIFISVYAVISVLTVFTSNDIVILTFTPFICNFCKAAKIDAVPYLIMEFVTANTWSLFLLIGNPTNIYISGAFGISFGAYLSYMALPTVAAGLTSLAVMLLLFRKKLKAPIHTETEITEINDKPLMTVALVHLLACIVLLTVSQYVNAEMWLISLLAALSVLLCSVAVLKLRHRTLAPLVSAAKGMPFEVIPFVIGMFVIVMGLDSAGVTSAIASYIGGEGAFKYGFLSMLSANLLNNIPMSVFFSKILAVNSSLTAVYATVVGSNIGAFITPVGALAGIMWSNLIKQNNVKMSVAQFVRYGVTVGVPTAAAALAVISIMS